ncbi:MAG: hypothetical protein WC538_11285 [Thermoanaerobaculia bacterium]
MNTPPDNAPRSEREIFAMIKAGVAYVERGDYKQGFASLNAVYGRSGELPPPPDGLSHYGLCVAILERQTRKGAALCRTAINHQFFNSAHFVNLVRLYIIRGNRKAAVETLHEGLTRLPNDRALLTVQDEIGHREEPIVGFLHRDNPINEALGKMRAKKNPEADSKKKRS